MELPTISYEEALKKEEEYKNRLRLAHPWALGLNSHQAPIKETTSHDRRPPFYANGESSAQRPPVQFQPQANPNNTPNYTPTGALLPAPYPLQFQPQGSTNYRPNVAIQQALYPNQQQRSRPPVKPRQQKLPPYVQISRPAPPMSYWCKLCKIDCTTEQNFRAHIGGKRHEAKKLSILQGKNKNNTRGESSGNHNGRNINQSRNHSLNENMAAECDIIRQEGEGSGSVKSAEPSDCSDGLIDLTTDE